VAIINPVTTIWNDNRAAENMDDEFLKSPSEQEFIGERTNRMGALNMALLFGTAVIAISLIVTPLLSSKTDDLQANTFGYDDIKTGSIPAHDGTLKHYTIRRSILQQDPSKVCIIDENGNKNGC
jgi:hypothetical protein